MDQGSPQVLHNYGTRKRQNSLIRPSLRLRQQSNPLPPSHAVSYHPRRIKPLGSVTPNANTTVYLKLQVNEKDTNDRLDKEGNRLSSSPTPFIEFPPKHVVLHQDDANNKVFIAMGRALLSVNNCAMTVKDLAELTLKFGLVCQNVSAAAQAITCFIRNHLHRCEVEQDFPLLLRFALSGTARDDCLALALYSRTGGNVGKDKPKEDAACDTSSAAQPDSGDSEHRKQDTGARLTCFRRGTTVWYLSKAAGAQCPFARCGIALRDFTDSSLMGEAPRRASTLSNVKEDGDSSLCGSKRKRAGLRTQSANGVLVRSNTSLRKDAVEEEEEEEEEEIECQGTKPPKVKLTLRLKPCLSTIRSKVPESSSSSSESESSEDEGEDSDAMVVDPSSSSRTSSTAPQPLQDSKEWSLPPYPIQRRISIPPYTPSQETYPSYNYHLTTPQQRHEPRRRSPSVPVSVASPPPESDIDSDEDFFMSSNEYDSFDYEKGPSQIRPIEIKKEEDVTDMMRGMIDWNPFGEDLLATSSFSNAPVKKESDFSNSRLGAAQRQAAVKLEEADSVLPNDGDWSRDGIDDIWTSASPEELRFSFDWVKREIEEEAEDLLDDVTSAGMADMQAQLMRSPTYDRRDAELLWKDVELLSPDSVLPQEFEDGDWEDVVVDTRRSVASASNPIPIPTKSSPTLSARRIQPSSTIETFSNTKSSLSTSFAGDLPSPSDSLPTCSSPGMTMGSLPSPSPSSPYSAAPLTPSADDSLVDIEDGVTVIHPQEYCGPLAIVASCVDGLPVYFTTSTNPRLYRQVEYDLVDLTSIAAFLQVSPPESHHTFESTLVNDQINTQLSDERWAPLSIARAFVDQHTNTSVHDLHIFLSEGLFRRFPFAIHELKHAATTERGASDTEVDSKLQPFSSPQKRVLPVILDIPTSDDTRPWERGMMAHVDVEELLLHALDPPSTHVVLSWPEANDQAESLEMPLSPQEEEVFQSLCRYSEWETEVVPSVTLNAKVNCETMDTDETVQDEAESRRVTRSMKEKDVTHEPPLRRSQRAAKTIATQRLAMSRTRHRTRTSSSSS